MIIPNILYEGNIALITKADKEYQKEKEKRKLYTDIPDKYRCKNFLCVK